MKTKQVYTGLEIAIIGMACRYPGASTWREYWENLKNGVESITFYSDEELLARNLDEKTIKHPDFIKSNPVLKDKDVFDSNFFDYRPIDVVFLNPLHRVYHECIWEALEDAGVNPDDTKGSIGLFAGGGEDLNWKVYSRLKNNNGLIDGITLSHLNNKDYLVSLLAYKLNLTGPAITVNTACSTSLVAVNLACKSLLLGETRVAVAGGVSIDTRKQKGYLFEEGMIVSRDGHCRAFDSKASGTVWSEGAGAVVLKRLDDALKDGDHIHAVIKGIAINNDGNKKVGFTAPSVEGQVDCIRRAQKFAKVNPDTISYVEAHGTGTRLGDPIEVEALNIAFNKNTTHKCALGSVKTNIGHADAAAGVAGLIKTALCLKYEIIPASLNFDSPNPGINFGEGPFYVNTETNEWLRSNGTPLRAGVSSFGVGGTNAHAIVEEPPVPEISGKGKLYKLLVLSAKTESSLVRYAEKLSVHLLGEPDTNLDDLSYTLLVGRKHFYYRKALVFSNRDELLASLEAIKGSEQKNRVNDIVKSVVFMFPGQGAQYGGMVMDIYDNIPVFRDDIDAGLSIIHKLTGEDFRPILFEKSTPGKGINETKYTQPLLFLVEYSLARYLMSIGITPGYMIGHSIGEYTAACISGVFSFEDALRLVIRRGMLMNSVDPGAMLSIPLAESDAMKYLGEGVFLAAVNSPESVVLSGNFEAIDKAKSLLDKDGIAYITLHTSHAFHSGMQDGILQEFRSEMDKVTFNKPSRPFISNLTGKVIADEEAMSPDYWVRHMRHTVKFSSGVSAIAELSGENIFIEVGPGRSLSGLLKQHKIGGHAPAIVNLLKSAKDTDNDFRCLTEGLGQFWAKGGGVNWDAYFSSEQRLKQSLPTYSFEPVKYATEVDPFEDAAFTGAKPVTGSVSSLPEWFYVPFWKRLNISQGIFNKDNSLSYIYIFADDPGMSNYLADAVMKDAGQVIFVRKGQQFVKGDGYYEINPSTEADFVKLFKDSTAGDNSIINILYLWSSGIAISGEVTIDAFDFARDVFFDSLLNIARAIRENDILNDVKLKVISNELFDVCGGEKISPERAILFGPLQIIPLEYLNISCQLIDIDMSANGISLPGLCEIILREIRSSTSDHIVAYRNGHRWVRHFEQITVDARKTNAPFKDGGVYLITGGTGGIGLAVAEYIASLCKAVIVLTGRSYFPAKELWDAEIEKLPDYDSFKNILLRIKGISDSGSEVFYYQVDVADTIQMMIFKNDVLSNHGKVNGIIHSAGVSDGRMIQFTSKEMTDKVFSAKVKGSILLRQYFGDAAFMVLCSSLASVVPYPGQVSYTSANNFMDAFAYQNTNENFLVTSVNWDYWRDSGLGLNAYLNQLDYKNFEVKESRIFNHYLFRKKVEVSITEVVFVSYLTAERDWFLKEHRISADHAVMPGTAYLEMMNAAFSLWQNTGYTVFTNASFHAPMLFSSSTEREVHVILRKEEGRYKLSVRSRDRSESFGWLVHATGEVFIEALEREPVVHNISEIERNCTEATLTKDSNTKDLFYSDFYGPRWNNRSWIKQGKDYQLSFLELDDMFLGDIENYKLHPALLDMATYYDAEVWDSDTFLPFRYEKLTVFSPLPSKVFSIIHRYHANSIEGNELKYDVVIADTNGLTLVNIEGFTRLRISDRGEHSKRPVAASQAKGQEAEMTKRTDGISDAEGKEIFGRLIEQQFTQVLIYAGEGDLNYLVKNQLATRRIEGQENAADDPAISDSVYQRPDLSVPYVAPATQQEGLIADIWAAFFSYDKVGINDDFFELGGDSLKVMSVISLMQKKLNVNIPAKQFFSHPTVLGMSAFLGDSAPESATDDSYQKDELSSRIVKIDEDF